MRLNPKDAKLLLSIQNGEILKRASFGKGFTKIREQMVELGALDEKQLTKNSYSLFMGKEEAFKNYLENYLYIDNLQKYIVGLSSTKPTRATLVNLGISSKLKSTHPKTGLHVNSPDNIEIIINDKPVHLDFPKGCALFIHINNTISLSEDILIVGVENFENISGALKQRDLLPSQKILFVERSKALKALLQYLPNQYLHFGDIDLAGISIYQTEYAPIVKERGSFFIPDGIENLLTNKKLFENQESTYSSLVGITLELQNLIDLIKDKRKVIEQEYFLKVDSAYNL